MTVSMEVDRRTVAGPVSVPAGAGSRACIRYNVPYEQTAGKRAKVAAVLENDGRLSYALYGDTTRITCGKTLAVIWLN